MKNVKLFSLKLLSFLLLGIFWGCTPQYSPAFKVIDTDFSKGRLTHEQTIDLNDLMKFHGHLCDGLIVGAQAMQIALEELYPNETIDRTNLRMVSKPSPCLTDVAVYVSGGRYQFNTFYVDKNFEGLFIIQRIDNNTSVSVSLNPGVKPAAIDSLGAIADKGELPACDLDALKEMEDDFSEQLLRTDPNLNYTVKKTTNFEWAPNFENTFTKTDVLNKNLPNCN